MQRFQWIVSVTVADVSIMEMTTTSKKTSRKSTYLEEGRNGEGEDTIHVKVPEFGGEVGDVLDGHVDTLG
jgi:hypothetical protein